VPETIANAPMGDTVSRVWKEANGGLQADQGRLEHLPKPSVALNKSRQVLASFHTGAYGN